MKTTNLVFCAICIVVASAAKIPSEFDFSAVKSAIVDPRIVNGENAEEGQFPYQVSLRNVANGRHYCGGSIIGRRFILTAGHCSQGEHAIPEKIYAVVGTLHNNLQDGLKLDIDRVITHKDFVHRTLNNDITLLRTTEEITFSDTIQPIALPKRDLPSKGNTPVIVSGWGSVSIEGSGPAPENLQFSKSRTISLDECRERLSGLPKDDADFEAVAFDSTICTMNEETTGICYGDSGGPLVDVTDEAKKSLIGIVSWTALKKCTQGYPDGYLRVYSYLDWIQERIEENSSI